MTGKIWVTAYVIAKDFLGYRLIVSRNKIHMKKLLEFIDSFYAAHAAFTEIDDPILFSHIAFVLKNGNFNYKEKEIIVNRFQSNFVSLWLKQAEDEGIENLESERIEAIECFSYYMANPYPPPKGG